MMTDVPHELMRFPTDLLWIIYRYAKELVTYYSTWNCDNIFLGVSSNLIWTRLRFTQSREIQIYNFEGRIIDCYPTKIGDWIQILPEDVIIPCQEELQELKELPNRISTSRMNEKTYGLILPRQGW